MMVNTTRVLLACAVATRLVSALEFQTFQPESPTIVPSPLIWRPKNATVLNSENFHVE